MKFFREDYPGARNSVRVAKALFRQGLKSIGKQPWGYFLQGCAYSLGRRTDSTEREEDVSGAKLFTDMLKEFEFYRNRFDEQSPVLQGLRDATANRVNRDAHTRGIFEEGLIYLSNVSFDILKSHREMLEALRACEASYT